MRQRAAFHLAAAVAAALVSRHAVADSVSVATTVTVISADGTVIAPPTPAAGPKAAAPAAGQIWTVEGVWTFGAPADASGDYPILLNGSNANGGWAAVLKVVNGHLYAQQKSGAYWVRWDGRDAAARQTRPPGWFAAAAPVEGTVATALSLSVVLPKIAANAPAGTVVATANVTMSPAGAAFTGPLVISNPILTAHGASLVLNRALGPSDVGALQATITAVQ